MDERGRSQYMYPIIIIKKKEQKSTLKDKNKVKMD